jgi:hypothetical protein
MKTNQKGYLASDAYFLSEVIRVWQKHDDYWNGEGAKDEWIGDKNDLLVKFHKLAHIRCLTKDWNQTNTYFALCKLAGRKSSGVTFVDNLYQNFKITRIA